MWLTTSNYKDSSRWDRCWAPGLFMTLHNRQKPYTRTQMESSATTYSMVFHFLGHKVWSPNQVSALVWVNKSKMLQSWNEGSEKKGVSSVITSEQYFHYKFKNGKEEDSWARSLQMTFITRRSLVVLLLSINLSELNLWIKRYHRFVHIRKTNTAYMGFRTIHGFRHQLGGWWDSDFSLPPSQCSY